MLEQLVSIAFILSYCDSEDGRAPLLVSAAGLSCKVVIGASHLFSIQSKYTSPVGQSA